MSKIIYFIYLINYIHIEITPSSHQGYKGGVNGWWVFFLCVVGVFLCVVGFFFMCGGVFLQAVGFFTGVQVVAGYLIPLKHKWYLYIIVSLRNLKNLD